METVPSKKRQRWLLAQLRELIDARGAGTFLAAPIVEPSPRYFPDGWVPDVRAATKMTERLLLLAGLGEQKFEVREFEDVSVDEADLERSKAGGLYCGMRDGVCTFGINVNALSDPEIVAGTLAHEVTHAYRDVHGLVVGDRDLEEKLTDLTTVHLGFGILCGNAAEHVASFRRTDIVGFRRSRGGYLGVADLAFLLAAQVVARGRSGEFRRVVANLESGQAVCFRQSHKVFTEDPEALREQLHLPTDPLPSTDAAPLLDLLTLAAPRDDRWTKPWGRYTYRARRSRTLMGVVVGFVLWVVLSTVAVQLNSFVYLVLTWAAPVAGGFLGGRLVRYTCGIPDCGARIPASSADCPSCHRFIIGTARGLRRRFRRGDKEGLRVFRLRGTHAGRYGVWGNFAGYWIAGTALSSGVGFWPSMALLGATVLVAFVVGRRIPRYTCTARDCRTELDPAFRVCPQCLGEIRGEVTDVNQAV